MDITRREKTLRELVVETCWEYLRDNFHKFNDTNKLKVALAISAKSLPQEFQGLSQQIVVMNEIKKNDQPLRFSIGDPVSSEVA
jgi:hypothetical protein